MNLGVLFSVVLMVGLGCASTRSQILANPQVSTQIPMGSPEARGLILIIHGANTSASRWPRSFLSRIEELDGLEDWDLYAVNWPDLSDRYLTAPVSARRLGQILGEQLAQHPNNYQVIHILGSSMGAHVTQGLVDTYREQVGSRPPDNQLQVNRISSPFYPGALIHVTLLDPFLLRGLFSMQYGRRNFGRNADLVENYFSRSDPVLFTNRPIRRAINYNLDQVIPFRENPNFSYYHDYPLTYYRNSIRDWSMVPGFIQSPFGLDIFSDSRVYFSVLFHLRSQYGQEIILSND